MRRPQDYANTGYPSVQKRHNQKRSKFTRSKTDQGSNAGIAQALVIAGEDLVVVTGDDDAVDDVSSHDDAALAWSSGAIRLYVQRLIVHLVLVRSVVEPTPTSAPCPGLHGRSQQWCFLHQGNRSSPVVKSGASPIGDRIVSHLDWPFNAEAIPWCRHWQLVDAVTCQFQRALASR